MLTFLGRALIGVALFSSAAHAQRVAPMIYELEPAGERATTVLRLENTQARPMTIEVMVYERQIAPDGSETRKAADDDFLIFPPQSLVQPGTTQSFRVRYVGTGTLDATKMYVVSVNQVPVQDEASTESVQFVVNFATAAYVTPAGLKSDVKATSATLVDAARVVQVEVKNNGLKYASLARSTFTVTDASGASFSLTDEPLRTALGLTVVPAGGSRVFRLPVPEGTVLAGPLTATVKYDPDAGVG